MHEEIIAYGRELLYAGIHHPQWEIRFAAAEVLAELKEENAASLLEEGAKASDGCIRDRAIVAFGKLQSRQAIPYLKEALQDSDAFVRGHALEALSLTIGKDCLESIEKAMGESNYFVQECAAVSLSFLPKEVAHPVWEAMIAESCSCVYPVKLSVAGYLARDGNERGREFLLRMLDYEDRWIGFLAAKNLAQLGDESGVGNLKRMLESGGWKEKISALEGLLSIRVESDVVDRLYRPAEAPDELARVEIIRLLDRFSPDKTLGLLRAAFRSEDEQVKIRVLQVLGELKRPELFSLATDIFKKGPEHLRAYLIASVEKAESYDSMPHLFFMMQKAHFLVRFQAARVALKMLRPEKISSR